MEEEKRIDETWKEKVSKEKEGLGKEEKFSTSAEVDFSFFITTLAMQVTIALGDAPNPVTNKKEIDLNQAKFLIDTLGVLKEKTKGNLSKEEENLLENLLYELRMRYAAKSEVKNED